MKKVFVFVAIAAVFSACANIAENGADALANVENQKQTFFKNEIKPPLKKPCFEGAYYRKLVSSNDDWVGIDGTVVLPTIKFDQNRKNPKKAMQYMDNPSIYFGGNMDEQETDIGLTWEVVKDKQGNVSKERVAFRPFLRRAEYKDQQKPFYENAPATADYYWYPGEEVKMSLVIIADKTLRFVVEGAGKKFQRDFICNGFVLGRKGEFKRVNAIDQVGNEGSPVKATATQVIGATWKETNLYRNVNNKTIVVPFHNGRYTEMQCPDQKFFKVEHTEEQLKVGAEKLTISGNGLF